MTWWAEGERCYPVAELRGGAVVLLFGKHKGLALGEVPEGYLRWMAGGHGASFLPADLLDLVAGELAARQAPPSRPGAFVVQEAPILTWGVDAPAGAVEKLIADLDALAERLRLLMASRGGWALAEVDLAAILGEEAAP